MQEAEVVVVGAGLAGLSSARRLSARGRDVVVLEARDRVGGRVLTARLSGGRAVELGGQWIGPGQHRMDALVRELGLNTVATHTQGDNLFEFGGRTWRSAGALPPVPFLAWLDIAQLAARGLPKDGTS